MNKIQFFEFLVYFVQITKKKRTFLSIILFDFILVFEIFWNFKNFE